MGRISFTVQGEPYGKGRPKFSTKMGFARAVTPEKTINFETLVKMEYRVQCNGFFFPPERTLGMLITAHMSTPKSESKKRIRMMLEGLIRPGKKPDFDNVAKIVCDALNGIAFRDDTLIVDGRVVKVYGEQPYTEIEIWEVADRA